MKVRILINAVAFSTVILSSPALADWQYTKWEMTPAEVVKAAGGRAIQNSDAAQNIGSEKALLVSSSVVGPFSFATYFMFENGKLVHVRQILKDGSKCGDLHGALATKYGRTATHSSQSSWEVTSWHDAALNNNVGLIEIGSDSCTLVYGPLLSSKNKGL